MNPRVARGFRLQWEEAQGCHVLLYPEGMVKLNRSAGEILRFKLNILWAMNDAMAQRYGVQGVGA